MKIIAPSYNEQLIPDKLRHLNNWVLWARSPRKDGKGTDKTPVNAKTMGNAQSNNPGTWADYKTACNALRQCEGQSIDIGKGKTGTIAGLGFMLTGSGIVCIDLDHVSEDLQAYREGKQQGIVWEFLTQTEGRAYAEISQSGEGIHIFASGQLPEGSRRKNGIEMYDTGRFIAMTGNIVDDNHTTLTGDCTDVLTSLHGKYLAPKQKPAIARQLDPIPVQDVDIQKALYAAARTNKKFLPLYRDGDISLYDNDHSRADQALCDILCYYLHGDTEKIDAAFRTSALYRAEKWDRPTGSTTYGRITTAKAIQGTYEYFNYNAPVKASSRPDPEPPADVTQRETAPDPAGVTPSEPSEELGRLGFSLKWKKQKDGDVYDGIAKCNRNTKLYISFRNLIHDIRYNEFAGYAERLKGDTWQRVTDCDLLEIIARIEERSHNEKGIYADLQAVSKWDLTKDFISDYLLTNAKKVNPVKEYLEGLTWDGVCRIDTLLHDVFEADSNEYTAAAMRLFMLGIISRVYKPGTKFDYMLILQGHQGYGKSAFLKALAVNENWYTSVGSEHMKDTKLLGETAAGKLILEYEELDGIRQTAAEKLKATITRTDDQYRQAYKVLSEEHPRQYVFAGTTNNGQYLSDPTGNRRFLPIPINKKGFLDAETVNQIWAEAYTLYTQGKFTLYLEGETEEAANEYRELATHLICDDYIDDIQKYLNTPTPSGYPIQKTTPSQIYMQLHDTPLGKLNPKEAEKIIRQALGVLGWESKVEKIKGTKKCKRRYVRPAADTKSAVTGAEDTE